MIVLTEEELVEYTKKERPSAQARVLDFMGIPYRPRPGSKGRIASLAVLRIHVETIEGQVPSARLASEPVLQP